MSFDASVLDRLGLVAGLALSIKATVVLAIGAAAAWLLRRRSAAARHFVWLLTLNGRRGSPMAAVGGRGMRRASFRRAVQRRGRRACPVVDGGA